MNKILKEIDDQFFQAMEEFMWQEFNNFYKHGIKPEDIKTYIPNYLMRMYETWQAKVRGYMPEYNPEAIKRFRGVQIIDNYDNTVVVSFKDIHLWPEKFKPAILPVFGNG